VTTDAFASGTIKVFEGRMIIVVAGTPGGDMFP
jgi:hypothetical protein